MSIVIRPLTEDDFSRGFLETLGSLSPVELTSADAIAIWKERPPSSMSTVVADLLGEVVGTASLIIERKFIHRGGRVGHIEDVAVHRDHSGRGIGTQLIRHLTELATGRGCYKVILSCSDDMVAFYGRIGFHRHDNGMRFDCPPPG